FLFQAEDGIRERNVTGVQTCALPSYQINSVALSNGGSIAALAEVIYDQYKLPVDYYVSINMQALTEVVDNFGGIEVYIPHDMEYNGSFLAKEIGRASCRERVEKTEDE